GERGAVGVFQPLPVMRVSRICRSFAEQQRERSDDGDNAGTREDHERIGAHPTADQSTRPSSARSVTGIRAADDARARLKTRTGIDLRDQRTVGRALETVHADVALQIACRDVPVEMRPKPADVDRRRRLTEKPYREADLRRAKVDRRARTQTFEARRDV